MLSVDHLNAVLAVVQATGKSAHTPMGNDSPVSRPVFAVAIAFAQDPAQLQDAVNRYANLLDTGHRVAWAKRLAVEAANNDGPREGLQS